MLIHNRIFSLALIGGVLAFTPVYAQPSDTSSSFGTLKIKEIAGDLNHPWGMAFLPDGCVLVTERAGRLRLIDKNNTLSEPLSGTPEVVAAGQGGLLDVALHPDFNTNQRVYLSYTAPAGNGSQTALGYGQLNDNVLTDFKTIFRQMPVIDNDKHFGGRISFDKNNHVYLAMGERFQFDPAQDLSNHLGAIIRLDSDDGSVPEDNPFMEQNNAKEEIWSYGHRNIEGMAFADNGNLWVAEMGPKGGDELNLVQKGGNYGWPLVSWGMHYDGEDIPDPDARPEFIDAAKQWTPVIAPSGLTFYEGDMYEAWQGDALIGGLVSKGIVRVDFQNGRPTDEERINLNVRIRDVDVAPDGSIYVLTDQSDGGVWRLTPAE